MSRHLDIMRRVSGLIPISDDGVQCEEDSILVEPSLEVVR